MSKVRHVLVDVLAECPKDHGHEGNPATVYGHHDGVRVCIRLFGTDTWVYDPGWEEDWRRRH